MKFATLLTAFATIASTLAAPEGSYSGGKTILGETVNANVEVLTATTMDFAISGVIDISCAGESYTLSGSTVTLDNVGVAGNCVHDALESNSVTLKQIMYDDASDQFTVSVKYSVMSIDLVLAHDAPAFLPMTLMNAPSGTYTGSKTVVGQTVGAEIIVTSDSLVEFIISGIIDIDCKDEEYKLVGSDVSLLNIDKAGDCAHDALADNNVSLKSVVYDETNDIITVSVKYSVMNIDIVLSKTNMFAPVVNMLAASPTGTYTGSKTIAGQTVNGQVNFQDASLLEFIISGLIDIDCKDEAYTLSGSDIVITNVLTAGDCAHDALADNSVSLKSVTYNDSSDEITVSVKYSIMNIDIVMTKQASVVKANLRGATSVA